MTKAILCVCALSTLTLPALLHAQSPTATPSSAAKASPTALPPGPLLASPEFAAWQVVTSCPSDQPADKGAAKVVSTQTITKTGQIRMEITDDAGGGRLTKWVVEDAEVALASGQPPMLLTGRSRKGGARPTPASSPTASPSTVLRPRGNQTVDFPEIAWISAQNFTGITKVAGVDCLTFKDRLLILTKAEMNDAKSAAARLGQTFDEDSFKEPATACVSVESRLPISATRGKNTLTYRFLPAPTQVQAVPPEVQTLIDLEARRQQDLARPPARS